MGLQVAYPKDSQNLLSKVNQTEKEEDAKLVAYLKEVAKTIESLKAEVSVANRSCLKSSGHFIHVCFFVSAEIQADKYPTVGANDQGVGSLLFPG